eukprot:6778868-Prymnesium_polylepis.1
MAGSMMPELWPSSRKEAEGPCCCSIVEMVASSSACIVSARSAGCCASSEKRSLSSDTETECDASGVSAWSSAERTAGERSLESSCSICHSMRTSAQRDLLSTDACISSPS